MPATTGTVTLRIGARVLLLDPADRVLLIHALDPTDPGRHWWELPGGGLDEGDDLRDTESPPRNPRSCLPPWATRP